MLEYIAIVIFCVTPNCSEIVVLESTRYDGITNNINVGQAKSSTETKAWLSCMNDKIDVKDYITSNLLVPNKFGLLYSFKEKFCVGVNKKSLETRSIPFGEEDREFEKK